MSRARGVVVERDPGLPHRFGVRLADGPEAGIVYVLVGNGKVGWVVDVTYEPADQFATIVRVLE